MTGDVCGGGFVKLRPVELRQSWIFRWGGCWKVIWEEWSGRSRWL